MKKPPTQRRILGPFNRVEGDLEVHVAIDENQVSKAWVNSPLFRGFEQILQAKDPLDALVYTPRICGICSVSQSIAAAQALAVAQGIQICPNGQLAANLILAAENMADHLTHFYLFFMPDFARPVYADKNWFDSIQARFKAQTGTATKEVLPARAALLHLTGILAGKWPHSLAIQPGGTTRPITAQEKISLLTIIRSFRHFLQETLFGAELEQVAAIQSANALSTWQQSYPNADFSRFLMLADDLNLDSLGRAGDCFMSYGAYHNQQTALFKAGVWQHQYAPLEPHQISEDLSHSWLSGEHEAKHPFEGSTLAGNHEPDGYSWCKAPRLDGKMVEVGAIARQIVNGQALIQELVSHSGSNVHHRVVARLLELALVVPEMEKWCQQIHVQDTFCLTAPMPEEAQGAGLVEAARGSLGHWLSIKGGRIDNYQIIAPTTWNFSPRDASAQPGALELALQGTRVEDEAKASVAIQHIIRSFDPCMVCTVH